MRDTGDFTRGPETRDDLAFLRQGLSLFVDADAAHGVVGRRHGLDHVVLALAHVHEAATVMEVLVVALAGHGGDAVNGLLQLIERDLREVGDALKVIAGRHDALLREGVVFGRVRADRVGDLADVVVPENPAVAARLLQDGFGEHDAAVEFFHEALAFLVEHDGAVKAGVGDQFDHARDRVADRVGLDVAHVDEFGTGLFGDVEGFTRGTRSVGRHEAFVDLRVVLLDHFLVRAEAARGENHAALGVERVFGTVHRGLDARDAAVLVKDEVRHLHVRDDGDAEFVGLGLELRDEFRAGVADRNQGALAAVSAEEEEVVVFKADAEVVAAPESGVESLMRHHVDDLHVALAVTALERVLSVEFGRVVVDAELGLDPVLRGVHFSAGDEGVAADGGHLFKQNDVRAGVLGFDGGRETGTARADHDDVIRRGLGEILGDLLDGLLVGLRERDAGLLGGVLHGVKEALGGERGARNHVEVGRVRGDDLILQVRVNAAGKNLVFLFLHDLDVGDLAAVKRDGNRHVAVLAHARAFRRNGGGHGAARKNRGDQGRNQRLLHHNFFHTFVICRSAPFRRLGQTKEKLPQLRKRVEYIRPFGRFPVRTNPKILIFPFLRGRDSLLGIFTSSPTDRSEIAFWRRSAKVGYAGEKAGFHLAPTQARSRSARISAKTASF